MTRPNFSAVAMFLATLALTGCGGDSPAPTGKGGEFPWMVPTAYASASSKLMGAPIAPRASASPGRR